MKKTKTKEKCEKTNKAKDEQGKRPRGESNIKEEKRTDQHQRRQGKVKDIKGIYEMHSIFDHLLMMGTVGPESFNMLFY